MLCDFGFNQFEWARWCENGRGSFKNIQVSIVSEKEKQFDPVIRNIIASKNTTVLRTSFNYDYQATAKNKVYQEIFYRGQYYEITSVSTVSLDIAPQALGLVNAGINKQTILELLRVK